MAIANIICYTSLFGPKAVMRPPAWERPGLRYVCFTDRDPNTIPAPWEIRRLNFRGGDPARNAKSFKILPHVYFAGEYNPETDINIWVDANFEIKPGFDELLPELEKYSVVMYKHVKRSCIYKEYQECRLLKLDKFSVMRHQMLRYRREGFPDNYGLTECGTMLRRFDLPCQKLMDRWWFEIFTGSRRDQLSFMYCVWKMGMRDRLLILPWKSREGRHHIYHEQRKQLVRLQ